MLFFVERILKMVLKVEHQVRVDWAVFFFFFIAERLYLSKETIK